MLMIFYAYKAQHNLNTGFYIFLNFIYMLKLGTRDYLVKRNNN